MRVRITERLMQMLAHSLKSKNAKLLKNLNDLLASLDIHHCKFTAKPGKKAAKTDGDPNCRVEQTGEIRGHEIQYILQKYEDFVALDPDNTKRELTRQLWISWTKIQYFLLATDIGPEK